MDKYVSDIVKKAKESTYRAMRISSQQKNTALVKMADYILDNREFILNENKKDLERGVKNKLKKSFLDRMLLTEKRLTEMSSSLKEISQLPDPVNKVIDGWQTDLGLSVEKVRVPIGVILMIYEARPNVTSDCIGLMFKSSNIGILRGSGDTINSNWAIGQVLKNAIKDCGITFEPFFIIERTSHEIIDLLLKEDKYIDLVIPRGGEALIEKVVETSRIPVIKHYKGVCHIFVDKYAGITQALKICINAKVDRPSVCNAVETLLIHKDTAKKFLPLLKKEFDKYGVEIRGDKETVSILKNIKKAKEEDWFEEYLDLIVSIKVVDDIEEAITHINFYGSHHTDSIITENVYNSRKFVKEVDSACCFVNISTRFSDGFQFGLGAEIGISTDKLHARGPMGLEELTTYKWIVNGEGQIRE